jgi:serine/threonine protein phosphatase 1
MRTLVIGDIHGALLSLQDVLKKCNYDADNDKLIFVGDYVDGWGQSAEVVDYLIGIYNKAHFNYKGDEKVIFIRGNHDVWCQRWLNNGEAPIMWTQQGGQSTLDSYVRTALLVEQSHKDFFNNLKDWHIDKDNRLYIHGGWAYQEDKFPNSAKYKTSVGLECHWDRTLLAGAASASHGGRHNDNVFNATKDFKEVFIGHTATKNYFPLQLCNLWDIDTGCGWGGKLTAMDVDTKEYWQSDFSKDLYPDERGRGVYDRNKQK